MSGTFELFKDYYNPVYPHSRAHAHIIFVNDMTESDIKATTATLIGHILSKLEAIEQAASL